MAVLVVHRSIAFHRSAIVDLDNEDEDDLDENNRVVRFALSRLTDRRKEKEKVCCSNL
jgi:hypothetical protein